jgi:hypothetical protein
MSDYELARKSSLRSNATRKSYSPESNNDFDELIDDRNASLTIDNSNVIMKTPQSLDDLLDVDDNNNQNDEDKDENEVDERDDDDSTRLSVDDTNPTEQKKSVEKNGKI